MTMQANDRFVYDDKSYSISAIQFPKLFFDIHKIGIYPGATSSACWRGYVATFCLHENFLVLKALDTNNNNGRSVPVAINGIMPKVVKEDGLIDKYKNSREWHYCDVNLKIPYSGNILITDDFIHARYVHMGFQSPISYRKVIELSFNDGELVDTKDISDLVAQIRETHPLESREAQVARLPVWIDECFDLSYRVKFNFDT